MGRPLIDLSGRRFGRYTVLARDRARSNGAGAHPRWLCVCDCGSFQSVFGTNLANGGTSSSCGCLRVEMLKKRQTTHGEYGTKNYWNWFGAQKRAKKHKATPPWADLDAIKKIYRARPSGHHVDHIIPLNSPVVCGLHCEANLQYLPALENLSKKNKLLVEHT